MFQFSFQDLKNRVSLAYIPTQKSAFFDTPEKAALSILVTFHTGIKNCRPPRLLHLVCKSYLLYATVIISTARTLLLSQQERLLLRTCCLRNLKSALRASMFHFCWSLRQLHSRLLCRHSPLSPLP